MGLEVALEQLVVGQPVLLRAAKLRPDAGQVSHSRFPCTRVTLNPSDVPPRPRRRAAVSHRDRLLRGSCGGNREVNGMTVDRGAARLARRHGLRELGGARAPCRGDPGRQPSPRRRSCSPTARSRRTTRPALVELLDAHPELVRARGTNGNDLLGMAGGARRSSAFCSSAAPTRTAATTTAGRSSTRPATRTTELAQVMLDAGGRLDVSARGDGGTPLVAALFWGHREVVALLGLEPRNLRVAAGLGLPELIRELARDAGSRRTPRLLPAARRLPGLAALGRPAGGAGRGARVGGEERPGRGARAPRRARRARRRRPLPRHGAHLGRRERPGRRRSASSSLSAPTSIARGTFGGPDHGEGVTALHLAAQAGAREAVETLLELGADPTIADALHDGTAVGLGQLRRAPGARGAPRAS